MNINKILKLSIFLITILFFQLQFMNLKADNTNKIDDEELPAIDPFAGGVGNISQDSTETSGQASQSNSLLNNMRLVGTIIGENKKIAIFSSPDGGVFKFKENDAITDSTMLIEVFNEVVIVQDESKNQFEVYMNNIIKPSGG
ncbi:MAG: hypothetical protein O3C61_04860 [Proteobacteria bacterium]|nr:hypothetical protein [Pseudomonadota bacterium]